MGEIGLETGTDVECDAFRAQLSLYKQIYIEGKKIGVHTPRRRKASITKMTLDILNEYPGIHDITVIDHTSAQTLPWVLSAGFHAGITISPVKTSIPELTDILADYPHQTHRIMVNSDSGSAFYDDFVEFCQNRAIPKTVRIQLSDTTAKTFFNKALF